MIQLLTTLALAAALLIGASAIPADNVGGPGGLTATTAPTTTAAPGDNAGGPGGK